MRVLVWVLLGFAILVTFAALVGFNVDLVLAALFYDPATGRFVAVDNPYAASLREHGYVAVTTCIGLVVLALLRLLPWRLPTVPARQAVALTLALLVGPGLLVNVVLKPHGGRPRPIEVTEFGGPLKFVNWWNPTGACDGNCSFMSGEASAAAWMFGPAMLAPPPWRAAALLAAGAFTATISVLRMAAGGHFLTDVLFGALSTILIIQAINRLLIGKGRA